LTRRAAKGGGGAIDVADNTVLEHVLAVADMASLAPIARLVGSDIAHAVPLTLIAGVGHWLLGSVDWVLLGSLVIGSLPGIFFGSHLSARVPDKVLRPVLATILVIVGVRML
jgi:uncharacterized membrane protein YfcA